MNGYGIFIWPAFGVVLLGLGWLMVTSLRQATQIKRQIAKQLECETK